MSALTAARNTPQRMGALTDYPVKAATLCHQGGIAVLQGGYAAPATTATGLIALGRFEHTADNRTGAHGAETAIVQAGLFLFNNSSAGDLITQAEVGLDCYLVDDQTVAKTHATNTRSRAGKIVAVENAGVWILFGLEV